MIKSLSSLYSFLHLTQNEVDSILKNIDISYKPKKEPKKKYENIKEISTAE